MYKPKKAIIKNATVLPGRTFFNCISLKNLFLPKDLMLITDTALQNVPKDLVIHCDNNSEVKKFAIKHGYRYRTDSTLNTFLTEISDIDNFSK